MLDEDFKALKKETKPQWGLQNEVGKRKSQEPFEVATIMASKQVRKKKSPHYKCY